MAQLVAKPFGILALTLALAAPAMNPVEAGGWGRRHGWSGAPQPTTYVSTQKDPSVYPTIGSYYPTNYMMVRGNTYSGGGYSPLDVAGDQTLSIYGPIAATRAISAPVQFYQRGYDGRVGIVPATALSYPNLPTLSPVVYPTQATDYYGFRESRTPPWWKNANTWVDQN